VLVHVDRVVRHTAPPLLKSCNSLDFKEY